MRERFSSPDEARDIAQHSASWIADFRRERDLAALQKRWLNWLSWADSKRVCGAIRDHVRGVYSEVLGDIKRAGGANSSASGNPVRNDYKTAAAGGER